MAIDINKKFLYINRDVTLGEMDEALCFPVSSFIGAETQTSSLIDLYFKGSKGTDATVVRIVHEQHGFIKTFYTNLVNEINFGEEAFINIYDHGRRNTFPSDISFNISTDVQPTFTLQDTDFMVADSISIGGHSVNDIDITNEFVDSDEHLMTSKAINARIAAAGGGVSVSDSTANTAFPVVFHDESNNLHDDTGAFTYNPSSGDLTMPGNLTVNGTDHIFTSSTNNKPHVTLSCGGTAQVGAQLTFKRTATGADNTDIGTIHFEGKNDADEDITYARINVDTADASDGAEEGEMVLSVASHDGELQPGLTIVSGNVEDEVDVTIANGSDSVTTMAGAARVTSDLQVGGELNLGDPTDTTLARSAAGTVTIEGNQIVTAGDEVVSTGNHILKQTKVTIDTSGFNGLNSTPVELVAAQGANTVIVPTEVILFHDRAATQTNSVDLIVAFDGSTNYLKAVKYSRRYMQNVTGDRVLNMLPYAGRWADNLTDPVNTNLTIALSGAATTNCVTSLTVYTSYYVIDIS